MKAIIFEELKKYISEDILRMDVPGHKGNYLDNEFVDYFGENIIKADVNSMKRLDNLNYSKSIINKSQKNIAKLHGALDARFLINGTTIGIQVMILSSVKEGQKILIPKNVHKSVQSSLILSGAIPVYMDVEFDKTLGIYTKLTLNEIEEKLNEHNDIKAALLINPSYYGVSYEFENIVKYLKSKNIIVLVDEAHGGIFYTQDIGCNAIKAGADMSAISYHKTLGTLTQTSLLLYNSNRVSIDEVDEVFTMLTTTSPSYILMANLEVTILNIFQKKLNEFPKMIRTLNDYKNKINNIQGLYVVDNKYLNIDKEYFDPLRLVISVQDLSLSGFEVYDILRDEYNIQCELGEYNILLCIITIFDTSDSLDRLVEALKDIALKYKQNIKTNQSKETITFNKNLFHVANTKQKNFISPRDMFYKKKKLIEYKKAKGKIVAVSVMIYPPGIPLILQGEVISDELIYYLDYLKKVNETIYGLLNDKIYIIDEAK